MGIWTGGEVSWRVEVALVVTGGAGSLWDVAEWDTGVWGASEPTWIAITGDVLSAVTSRGKDRWTDRQRTTTLQVTLRNEGGRYNPDHGADPPGDLSFRPGRRIRLSGNAGGAWIPVATAVIDTIDESYAPGGEDVITTVYAYGYRSLLSNENPPALGAPVGAGEGTDDRVARVLDAFGWSATERDLQAGVHTMIATTLARSRLEEIERAVTAEGGAFFFTGPGVATFKARDWLTTDPRSVTPGIYPGHVPGSVVADADLLVAADRYAGSGDWRDESGGGAAGALVNTPTHNGDHFSFAAASSEYVTFGDVAAADVGAADSMTVLMVVRIPDATPASTQYLISKRLNTAAGSPGHLARIHTDGKFLAGVSDGTVSPALIAPVAFQANVKTVVGYQINRTTGLLRTIFDGALTTGSASIAGLGSLANAQPLTLAILSSLIAPADVDMFAAGIWRRVLSPTEIVDASAELLAASPPGPTPAIIGVRNEWSFQSIRNDVQYTRVGGTMVREQDLTSQGQYKAVVTEKVTDLEVETDAQVEALAERFLAANAFDRQRLRSLELHAVTAEQAQAMLETELGDLVAARIDTLHGWGYPVLAHVMGLDFVVTGDDWTLTLRLDPDLVA